MGTERSSHASMYRSRWVMLRRRFMLALRRGMGVPGLHQRGLAIRPNVPRNTSGNSDGGLEKRTNVPRGLRSSECERRGRTKRNRGEWKAKKYMKMGTTAMLIVMAYSRTLYSEMERSHMITAGAAARKWPAFTRICLNERCGRQRPGDDEAGQGHQLTQRCNVAAVCTTTSQRCAGQRGSSPKGCCECCT